MVKGVKREAPGGLAQLGEHLLCKQGVVGSIPSSSTKVCVLTASEGTQHQSGFVRQHEASLLLIGIS